MLRRSIMLFFSIYHNALRLHGRLILRLAVALAIEQHIASPEVFFVGNFKATNILLLAEQRIGFYYRFAAQIYVLMLRKGLCLYVYRPISCFFPGKFRIKSRCFFCSLPRRGNLLVENVFVCVFMLRRSIMLFFSIYHNALRLHGRLILRLAVALAIEQHIAPPEVFFVGNFKATNILLLAEQRTGFYYRFAAQIYVLRLRRGLCLYVYRSTFFSSRQSSECCFCSDTP
jgi:hypothetical protein